MTEPDEARSQDVPVSMPQHQLRVFWTAAALAIAVMLLLCAILVVVAATRR